MLHSIHTHTSLISCIMQLSQNISHMPYAPTFPRGSSEDTEKAHLRTSQKNKCYTVTAMYKHDRNKVHFFSGRIMADYSFNYGCSEKKLPPQSHAHGLASHV